MPSNQNSKLTRFNPAILPMEYMPRIADVVDEQHAKHYLIPGKVFASADPFAITTILGSGMALCLCDPQKGIGGASHFNMPLGSDALNEALLQRVLTLGANLEALEAKIFGGSHPQVTFGNSNRWLGDRNVEAALDFLKTRGIRLAEKETGGVRGRKLIYQTDDGCAWAHQL